MKNSPTLPTNKPINQPNRLLQLLQLQFYYQLASQRAESLSLPFFFPFSFFFFRSLCFSDLLWFWFRFASLLYDGDEGDEGDDDDVYTCGSGVPKHNISYMARGIDRDLRALVCMVWYGIWDTGIEGGLKKRWCVDQVSSFILPFPSRSFCQSLLYNDTCYLLMWGVSCVRVWCVCGVWYVKCVMWCDACVWKTRKKKREIEYQYKASFFFSVCLGLISIVIYRRFKFGLVLCDLSVP